MFCHMDKLFPLFGKNKCLVTKVILVAPDFTAWTFRSLGIERGVGGGKVGGLALHRFSVKCCLPLYASPSPCTIRKLKEIFFFLFP